MLTFDDYKAKISIIQILEDLGYKQDISKGKVSPVFKLTDGAGNKLDEIIIKNPHSVQEHYYDRNYKGGDLIQFIKNQKLDVTGILIISGQSTSTVSNSIRHAILSKKYTERVKRNWNTQTPHTVSRRLLPSTLRKSDSAC